jgi:hypothetical protein
MLATSHHVGVVLGSFFGPEDGGHMSFRKNLFAFSGLHYILEEVTVIIIFFYLK